MNVDTLPFCALTHKALRITAYVLIFALFCAAGPLLSCAGNSDRLLPGAVALEPKRLEFATDSPGSSGNAILEYWTIGQPKDPQTQAAINALIGPQGAFEGLDETGLRAAFSRGERPFDEAKAEILYNGRGILQLSWVIQSTGPYTSTNRTTITVDTGTGALLGSEYMFQDDLALSRFVQARLAPKVEEAVRAMISAHPEEEETIRSLTEGLSYGPTLIFEAELGEDGMTFILPFEFPHAYNALEGESVRLFIPWNDLKPYSYPGSILERFPAFR